MLIICRKTLSVSYLLGLLQPTITYTTTVTYNRKKNKLAKNLLLKMESIMDETNNHFVNYKDLKILVKPIQTLKRGNKKCEREEVFRLVNDSLNKNITREAFELILNSMMTITQLTSMLLVNGNVCLFRKSPVKLVMIKLIITISISQKKFNLFK